MKRFNLILGAASVAVALTSCKNENETKAEKTVDTYVVYVDSIGGLAAADAQANWAAIEADYQQRTMEAEAALADMKDKEAAQKRLDDSKAKYEELKSKVQSQAAASNPDRKTEIRTSLFPAGTIGDDMSFAWVNKDNILKVYNDFYNAFDKNQESYSREDLDEIKLLYEALDNRKNTVEKEGLSGPDNRKIAELKVKFAPKFKWERITTKGEENKEAKQAAE
ncbi:hypothetical protein [Flavobacterium selenitireducens]|uniref:hypothetical protein n=1 Tax=Flavobacterium selenitireducens TaxID=2722704 RepID=UPI00168B1983|nr:hypothetical protein [Flavobacterium selenitireducens]MBD3582546.1 hypothetical protein [Flavobacterium selenitireducens]